MVQIRKRVKIQGGFAQNQSRAGESRRGDPCRIQNPEGGTLAQTLIAESRRGTQHDPKIWAQHDQNILQNPEGGTLCFGPFPSLGVSEFEVPDWWLAEKVRTATRISSANALTVENMLAHKFTNFSGFELQISTQMINVRRLKTV